MKAVDWAAKFAGVTPEEWATVLEEYGVETAELIALRSKSSTDKSRLSAQAGAVQEQRNKFRAVADRVPGLGLEKYEELLATHAKEFLDLKTKAEKKPEPAKESKDGNDGRKLHTAGKKPDNRNNRFNEKR